MNSRGHESPMDFEWQTHGPADVTSPFHKLAMEHSLNERKRTRENLETPQKPSTPALRAPNSQPFLFSHIPSSSKPFASSYRTPSFTTPQKKFEVDFSSGPENASSPDNADNADNEDTPEAPKAAPVTFGATDPDKAEKRNSLFGFYGRFAPSAPGRTDSAKSSHHTNALMRRVQKRRRREQNLGRQLVRTRRPSEDSSEDDGNYHEHDESSKKPDRRTNQTPAVHEVGYMAGLFTFIESYPIAPSLIAKYLQLFFNAAIILGVLFAIYSFWTTIQADVNRASEDAAAETLAEMAACAKSYVDNRCAGDARLPALEMVCSNWELCMNRDPNSVKRAKLSAHTFAEILNSFVEPISLKTMLFAILTIILSLAISNLTFSFLRRSHDFESTPYHQHPPAPPIYQQHQQHQQYPEDTSALSRHHHYQLPQQQGYSTSSLTQTQMQYPRQQPQTTATSSGRGMQSRMQQHQQHPPGPVRSATTPQLGLGYYR